MTKRCEHCGSALPDYGGIVFDEDRNEVKFNGFRIHLTGAETQVLAYFIKKKGRVVSKEMMMEQLYSLRPENEEADIKIVDVFVCKLRKKIKPMGLEIITHWGNGYSLKEPTPCLT